MPVNFIGKSPVFRTKPGASALKNTELNWDTTPHKGMQRPADGEFPGIIEELGKNLAQGLIEAEKTGNDALYQQAQAAADKAMAQYMSPVSPDRKSLMNEARQFKDMLNTAIKKFKNSTNPTKTLMDFFIERDGIITPATRGRFNVKFESGTIFSVTGSDLQPDMFDVRTRPEGEAVLVYRSGEWGYQLTSDELKLQQEFLDGLNSAKDRCLKQGSAQQPTMSGSLNLLI